MAHKHNPTINGAISNKAEADYSSTYLKHPIEKL